LKPGNDSYDICIAGGGLAGLAASIQLARKGYAVVLVEKEKFPFHKVCGEYISLESKPFLKSLGIALDEMDLPHIDKLFLSAPNGTSLTTTLPLGGFGISRYRLDFLLAQKARESGVVLLEESRVTGMEEGEERLVHIQSKENTTTIRARVCCAASGKRSNLDVKWNRSFLQAWDRRLNNYVGIKYHVRTEWKENLIGLHNFKNGYCGISRIEDGKCCVCYMTRADNLKASGNDIRTMEKNLLRLNPHLERIFQSAEILQEFPVTISQISFAPKTQVEKGVLMLGDAAGMITPLCGNGMSMALHSSKIASGLIDQFLGGTISQKDLEQRYTADWKREFGRRLKTGRLLQKFFGDTRLSNALVQTFRVLPFLAKPLIRSTHGAPF
jgi:flavin-dependent dehydrogenase